MSMAYIEWLVIVAFIIYVVSRRGHKRRSHRGAAHGLHSPERGNGLGVSERETVEESEGSLNEASERAMSQLSDRGSRAHSL